VTRLVLVVAVISGLAVTTAHAAPPRPTASQPEEDPRPRAALGACASGDFKKGVAILADVYAETRNPAFVFNQARCFQQNGQLDPARQRFAEYLRVGKNEPAEDLKRAQGYIKEIDETLARRAPPPAVVPPPAPAPIIVTAPAPAAPDQGRTSTLRGAGVGLTILGLAALGTGVFLSLKVRSTTHDVENQFANMNIVTDSTVLQRQLTNGGRYETWQWVSYGVGVAALAGAATTFLIGGFPFTSARPAAEKSVALLPVVMPGDVGGAVRLRF